MDKATKSAVIVETIENEEESVELTADDLVPSKSRRLRTGVRAGLTIKQKVIEHLSRPRPRRVICASSHLS